MSVQSSNFCFSQIIDKSKYDDERDEWHIPLIKKKNYDEGKQSFSGSSGSSFLPSIASGAGGGGGGMLPGITSTKSSMDQKFSSTLPANSWAVNVDVEDMNDNNEFRPASQSKNKKKSSSKNKEQYNNDNDIGNLGKSDSKSKIPIVPLLTLPGSLVSASSLISPKPPNNSGYHNNSASNQFSGRNNAYSNSNNEDYNNTPATTSNSTSFSLPGIGFNQNSNNYNAGANAVVDTNEEKKKNKSKNKLPKTTLPPTINNNNSSYANNSGNSSGYGSNSSRANEDSNRMPNIHSKGGDQSHSYPSTSHNASNPVTANSYANSYPNQTEYTNTDEVGTGETAGPLQDWGFASEPTQETNKKKTSKFDNSNPEDYDNEYYEDSLYSADGGNYPTNGKQKKKKASKDKGSELPSSSQNNRSMFPPIEKSTPRGGGGFSLPPI
jgi:hypothetical protein